MEREVSLALLHLKKRGKVLKGCDRKWTRTHLEWISLLSKRKGCRTTSCLFLHWKLDKEFDLLPSHSAHCFSCKERIPLFLFHPATSSFRHTICLSLSVSTLHLTLLIQGSDETEQNRTERRSNKNRPDFLFFFLGLAFLSSLVSFPSSYTERHIWIWWGWLTQTEEKQKRERKEKAS